MRSRPSLPSETICRHPESVGLIFSRLAHSVEEPASHFPLSLIPLSQIRSAFPSTFQNSWVCSFPCFLCSVRRGTVRVVAVRVPTRFCLSNSYRSTLALSPHATNLFSYIGGREVAGRVIVGFLRQGRLDRDWREPFQKWIGNESRPLRVGMAITLEV